VRRLIARDLSGQPAATVLTDLIGIGDRGGSDVAVAEDEYLARRLGRVVSIIVDTSVWYAALDHSDRSRSLPEGITTLHRLIDELPLVPLSDGAVFGFGDECSDRASQDVYLDLSVGDAARLFLQALALRRASRSPPEAPSSRRRTSWRSPSSPSRSSTRTDAEETSGSARAPSLPPS
jgi:hypothetical protein